MAAVAPCGSFTAYKRHKRKGEPVDEACAQAAREQKNERAQAKRDESAEVLRLAIADGEPAEDLIDELAEARWNLAVVRAAMQAGVPTGLAAVSKRYEELVSLVKRLEAQSRPEVSALDQLAQRRAERLAASSH